MEVVILFVGMIVGLDLLRLIGMAGTATRLASDKVGAAVKEMSSGEGIRKAMRGAYSKHHRFAVEGRLKVPDDTSLHQFALFGALASRYKVTAGSAEMDDKIIWLELTPFLNLPDGQAVEALAEYVVWKELPQDSRQAWLREQISAGLILLAQRGTAAWQLAENLNIGWVRLMQNR